MARAKIAVFSGPRATIANSPTLVTGNKGRLSSERVLPGRYDHLAPQVLHEPVVVRIRKYSAHPLEEDASAVYVQDGKDYYEVELLPEDGPYPLPYVARRADGSDHTAGPSRTPTSSDPALDYGGQAVFLPRRLSECSLKSTAPFRAGARRAKGSILDRKADFEFIRVLPPGGYTQEGGEVRGGLSSPTGPLPSGGHRGTGTWPA